MWTCDMDGDSHNVVPDNDGDNCLDCDLAIHREAGEWRHGTDPTLD